MECTIIVVNYVSALYNRVRKELSRRRLTSGKGTRQRSPKFKGR